jgi:aerobic carbon-monoxide dehydrogenase medium subunit
MREFHVGPYETVVGDAEMLTEVRFPIRPAAGSAYEKVERRVGDWAVAAAGAFVQLDGDTIADAGIGLTAVGAEHYTPGGRGRAARPAGHPETFAAAAQLCHDVRTRPATSAAPRTTSATSPGADAPGADPIRARARGEES